MNKSDRKNTRKRAWLHLTEGIFVMVLSIDCAHAAAKAGLIAIGVSLFLMGFVDILATPKESEVKRAAKTPKE